MRIKTTLFTIIVSLIYLQNFSQKTVYASDIIKNLKAGKDISISNAKIEGVLDFTEMEEKLKNLPKRKPRKVKSNSIHNLIAIKISFSNCIFENDVLAYIPDHEKSGYTFIADFKKSVSFAHCNFKGKSMFKLSKFYQECSFQGTIFQDDSTFKHADFESTSDFSKTIFSENITFKHTVFKKYVSFNESVMKENLNFKHTQFLNGVSLRKIKIDGVLNMKCMMVNGKFNMSGMKVRDDIDSKHTIINGQNFSNYLLNNK